MTCGPLTTGKDINDLIVAADADLARLQAAPAIAEDWNTKLTNATARYTELRALIVTAGSGGASLMDPSQACEYLTGLKTEFYQLGLEYAQRTGGASPIPTPPPIPTITGTLDRFVTAAIWLGGAYLVYKIVTHFTEHGAYPRDQLPRYAGGR